MAEDKKLDSVMLAVGVDPRTGQYNKVKAEETLIGDLKEETKKTIGEEFDQFKQEPDMQRKGDAKLPRLTELKKASQISGGNLNSEAALGLMRSIESNVVLETNKVQQSIMKTFLPVEVELKRTIDLLSSPNEMAQDEALDRMESIQKVMGVDFEKIANAMGTNVKELIAARQFQREERKKEEDLKENIRQERLQIRDELRERNINTILDEKTNTLRVQSFAEEKQFKKDIIIKEKELQALTRENNKTIKELRKKEDYNREDEKKILALKKDELKKEKELNEMKEKAGIKPQESAQGFLSQTFGAAFSETKNFGKELKMIGNSLGSTFKNLPGTIGNFAKGLGSGVLTVGRFVGGLALGAGKFLLFGLAIGLIIMGVYKLYQGIMTVINKIKSFFGFGGDKEKEKVENQPTEKTGELNQKEVGKDKSIAPSKSMGEAEKFLNPEGKVKELSKEEFDGLSKKDKDLYVQAKGAEQQGLLPISSKPTIQPIPKDTNVNKMSTDLMAAKEETKPANTVVAPTSQIVNNSNTTQSVTMSPTNLDRSFINLNSVPI